MTVTALQNFRMTGVEVILGKVDDSPFTGGVPGRKFSPIIETAAITFVEGMVAEDLLPGYWSIRGFANAPHEHPRLTLQYEGIYQLDTFDLTAEDFPLVVPGLLRIEK